MATVLKVVGLIIRDAAIELLLLVLFGMIVLKMSQGRDLIVSMFEPGGLYTVGRILLTILSLFAFSVSMWIIPAVIFEWRFRFKKRIRTSVDPFKQHLFFAHRVLPLIPFWLVAFALFNDNGWLFISLALLEVILFVGIGALEKTPKAFSYLFVALCVITIGFIIYFCVSYRQEYLSVKRALAVILYLLSIILFMVYYQMDKRILKEHFEGESTRRPVKKIYLQFAFLWHQPSLPHRFSDIVHY